MSKKGTPVMMLLVSLPFVRVPDCTSWADRSLETASKENTHKAVLTKLPKFISPNNLTIIERKLT
jgi:hypothetical protein